MNKDIAYLNFHLENHIRFLKIQLGNKYTTSPHYIMRLITGLILTTQIFSSEFNFPTIRDINNYGCYCHFTDNNNLNNYGPPQDDFDTLCSELMSCLRCPNEHLAGSFNFEVDSCSDQDINLNKDFEMPNILTYNRNEANNDASGRYVYDQCLMVDLCYSVGIGF